MGECPESPLDDESLIAEFQDKGIGGLRIELSGGLTHNILAEDLNFICRQPNCSVKVCKRNPLDGLLNGFILDLNQIKRVTTCS